MKRENWIWMPHHGHFCAGSRCKFKLNTYVGGHIVSTVGEMPEIGSKEEDLKWETIGWDRLYETMVFKAQRSENGCCPWRQADGGEQDFEGYNKPEDAFAGHMRMCEKWAKKGAR